MSWLRLDDGFAQHPKLTVFDPKTKWIWLELLLYCARFRTEGSVPKSIGKVVPGARPATLKRFVDAGLLDDTEHGLKVHGWAEYNRTDPLSNAERQRRYRQTHRNGDSNDERNANVTTGNGSSRARASGRVPSRPYVSKETSPTPRATGTNPRAQGTNPRALGTNPRDNPPIPHTYTACLNWIGSPAYDPDTMTADTVQDELDVIERRCTAKGGDPLTPEQRNQLLAAIPDPQGEPMTNRGPTQ